MAHKEIKRKFYAENSEASLAKKRCDEPNDTKPAGKNIYNHCMLSYA